jgi:hypothetical protein
MKPTVFLRVASILTLIHAALHTIGGVFGKVGTGPAAVAVEAMRVNRFLVMGNVRSFWDFYRGLGLAVSIALTAESIVFWQLSALAQTNPQRLRPILGTFLVAYLAWAVNSNAYFFAGPVIAEVLIAACLGMAFLAARVPAASLATAA